MTVESVHCPVCGRIFSSYENYKNHLPCHGSKILGAAGESTETASVQETEGGTGGGKT